MINIPVFDFICPESKYISSYVFGIEFIPSDNFWIGAGFNPKTHYDMKLNGANGFGGFSAGAGVSIKMFDISASIAKYHPSALSFMLGITASLSEF